MILGLMSFVISANAQSKITVNSSLMYTNFSFKDSQGAKDTSYTGAFSQAFHVGYRYMNARGGLLIRADLGMRNANATIFYDNSNYIWDLQYLDLKAGAGYLYSFGSIGAYMTLSPYFGYLLKGNQVLNNENFDIKKTQSLSNIDYGFFVSPGAQFNISENISFYTEFSYMMGLQNLETGETGQITKNYAFALTAGVTFSLGGE